MFIELDERGIKQFKTVLVGISWY